MATVTDSGKIVAKAVGKTSIITTVTIAGASRSFTTEIEVSKPYIELNKNISLQGAFLVKNTPNYPFA